jgi:hypothetical protein
MIPGFGGHLISEAFLEQHLSTADRAAAGARPPLADWLHRTAHFGPASSVRTLLEGAATPLLEALGFVRPSAVAPAGRGLAATVHLGQAVCILVLPWGERLSGAWSTAGAEALRRGAVWTVMFNGTHIAIVDAERPHVRRIVEFDLAVALEDARGTRALNLVLRPETFSTGLLRDIVDASDRHARAVCR